ncbi:Cdk-activating kinase assembly factor [Trema orientale]|uniref:Cdk-activating kinase assembly factor n=1 Tax=Trema orientale TaxID=63057 RepID=A0A2P5EBQ3_TREOI|nr:Cdk-activating kinase assembly factor [Trema orientale]
MAGDSADSGSSTSPNKRLKSIAEDENQGENSVGGRCAICFSEDGKAIRGEIDCCDHYFCFLCIMEWAKTESRCPICRRRFTTIRRPPKHGAFPRERLIKFPLRDQAFIHYGDTDGSFDPYAEVLCTVCHETTDENLLLLCDLCDSGAHTFCVGLGYTVPEGDWFCHDCTISKAEHANSETNAEDDNQNSTLLDIIQESCSRVVEKSPSRVSSDSNKLPFPAVTPGGARFTCEPTGPAVASKLTESGARTLNRCRNVHSRIRALRENWNALQRGSLSFSPGSFKPRCYSQKHEDYAVLHDRSSQVETSSSRSCEQLKNQVAIGSHDIDKAWKMMDIAKSKQCGCGKTSTLQSSKPTLRKAIASKERTNVNLNNLVQSQQLGIRTAERTVVEKPFKPYSFGKEKVKYRSPELEREKQCRVLSKEAAGCSSRLSLSRNIFTSTGGNTCKVNRSISLQKNVNRASPNIASEQNGSFSAFRVRQGTFDSFDDKSELSACSSKVDVPKGDTRLKNGSVESKVGKHDDAKNEIQSLVKLNLKRLSRGKQLGFTTFKEIARLATHTILAACGLEHNKKYGIYSFPSFVCSHADLSETKTNIMPESCQDCFYSFVKNVVNSIMLEKVDCTEKS